MTESALAGFDLGYEYINDADMERAQDWERRRRQERRDLINWFRSEVAFLWITKGTQTRRKHARN